ncbi:jg6938 [Pararge aegeria aegeria]|uniref:Jg6938 protein n=1 Tax=Pararge aegeria aegeria TaxID=348720 RepID=A0A8S4S686_9NEOP|nr:jg6938 [Pararge aegeria aegeria]
MDVGVLRCWNGELAPVNAAIFVGPQRDEQTTSNESLEAAANKRPRTRDLELPTKDLCQEVDWLKMMMMKTNGFYGDCKIP